MQMMDFKFSDSIIFKALHMTYIDINKWKEYALLQNKNFKKVKKFIKKLLNRGGGLLD